MAVADVLSVGSSFSNLPSLVSAVLYVVVMGVHPYIEPTLGVVLPHLLVPGTSFLVGGARVWEQKLRLHRSQLNLTLLTVGSVALI
jgi:Ca2+:H+ antiporter